MKYLRLIFLSLCFFGLTAKADPVNITCTTDPLTTSLAIFTVGTDVTVRVIHHNGVDFIPLSQTNFTPRDLAGLVQKAKALQQLGAQYDIHISSDQCRINNQKLISCHGSIDQSINGQKISYFSLDTSSVSTLSPLYPNPTLRTTVTLALTMDGKDYEFGVNFSENRCVDTSRSSLSLREFALKAE